MNEDRPVLSATAL